MVVQTPAGVTNSNDIVPMNLLPDHDDELELRGTLNWLMRLVVEPQEGSDLPDYMADRLTCIRRSIFASPTTAMPKLAQDLIAMEETLAKKTRTLNAMVGNTDWHEDLAVPPAPTVEKLASRWRDLRESVQDAVGLTRDDDLPQGHLALFLAGRSEEIMASNTSEVNLPSWIRDLKLGSAVQHAAHMIMGVILFVLVFSPTAAMHDAEAWKVADHIFGVIGEVGMYDLKSEACEICANKSSRWGHRNCAETSQDWHEVAVPESRLSRDSIEASSDRAIRQVGRLLTGTRAWTSLAEQQEAIAEMASRCCGVEAGDDCEPAGVQNSLLSARYFI
jgi:hypothetical protein